MFIIEDELVISGFPVLQKFVSGNDNGVQRAFQSVQGSPFHSQCERWDLSIGPCAGNIQLRYLASDNLDICLGTLMDSSYSIPYSLLELSSSIELPPRISDLQRVSSASVCWPANGIRAKCQISFDYIDNILRQPNSSQTPKEQ